MNRETKIASSVVASTIWLIIMIIVPTNEFKVMALANATLQGLISLYYFVKPHIRDYKARRLQNKLDRAGYESYKREVKNPYDEIL